MYMYMYMHKDHGDYLNRNKVVDSKVRQSRIHQVASTVYTSIDPPSLGIDLNMYFISNSQSTISILVIVCVNGAYSVRVHVQCRYTV